MASITHVVELLHSYSASQSRISDHIFQVLSASIIKNINYVIFKLVQCVLVTACLISPAIIIIN